MAKPAIHPTAIVSEGAVIADGVEIGPFCLVGENVSLGKNTKLFSHVVIEETVVGSDCSIFPFTSIGLQPQDMKYNGEKTGVTIGNNNIIREYVTIHRASVDGNKLTKLGNDNFIMAYAHIAHDCNIGNNIIIANATTFGGHCTVEDFAFIGGLVAVHQFVSVGRYSMIGGFSAINKDIPPYTTASNDRAKLYGLNTIGLKRRNFDDETIQDLKKAYKLLFRSKLPMKDAIESIKKEVRQCDAVKNFISFAEKNKRGLCR